MVLYEETSRFLSANNANLREFFFFIGVHWCFWWINAFEVILISLQLDSDFGAVGTIGMTTAALSLRKKPNLYMGLITLTYVDIDEDLAGRER